MNTALLSKGLLSRIAVFTQRLIDELVSRHLSRKLLQQFLRSTSNAITKMYLVYDTGK